MKKITNRILVSAVGLIFLLSSCAPAPAPTGNPVLDQELMDQSPALTAAAEQLQAKDQQLAEQSAALTAVGQTAQALQQAQPTSTAISTPMAESVPLPGSSDSTAESVPLPGGSDTTNQTETTSGTGSETYPLYFPAEETFNECTITILHSSGEPEFFSLPTRLPQLDDEPYNLKPGDLVIIVNPVNLRSGPSLSNRILMTLRPDLVSTLDQNASGAATPNPPTSYRIIGGPSYTDLSGYTSQGTPAPGYNVSERKYKWWQIESLNQAISGWIAEASACGQFYFMTPATPTTP